MTPKEVVDVDYIKDKIDDTNYCLYIYYYDEEARFCDENDGNLWGIKSIYRKRNLQDTTSKMKKR